MIPAPSPRRRGFSLIELLVSMTVLAILLGITVAVLNSAQRTWRSSKNRMEQFRDARVSFELITRNLSQATLNTYWDYMYSNGTNTPPPQSGGVFEPPTRYMRQSELHWITDTSAKLIDGDDAKFPTRGLFFVAPLGFTVTEEYRTLNNLLNARGYFIAFGDDEASKPNFVKASTKPRNRYRLWEYRPPTENLRVYETYSDNGIQKTRLFQTANPSGRFHWFNDANPYISANSGSDPSNYKFSRPIADNIIALIVSPRRSLSPGEDPDLAFEMAPKYSYDSYEITNPGAPAVTTANPDGTRHLLPPLVQVTLVALDETSAQRLEDRNGSTPPPEITAALEGKFVDANKYEDDLADLTAQLSAANLNHRVFSATIPIRSSKWDGRVR